MIWFPLAMACNRPSKRIIFPFGVIGPSALDRHYWDVPHQRGTVSVESTTEFMISEVSGGNKFHTYEPRKDGLLFSNCIRSRLFTDVLL